MYTIITYFPYFASNIKASLSKVCTARPRVVVVYRMSQPTIVATVATLFEVPVVTAGTFPFSQHQTLDYFVGGFIACLRSVEERFEQMKFHVRVSCIKSYKLKNERYIYTYLL